MVEHWLQCTILPSTDIQLLYIKYFLYILYTKHDLVKYDFFDVDKHATCLFCGYKRMLVLQNILNSLVSEVR